jgi:transcription elongation factor SPT5
LEADKQAHIQHAIERMNNVYGTKLQLVPVNEMVDCLRIRQKEIQVKIGMWVRVKRGKYGGDLAQVLDIADSGDNVTVKLIPRLDFSKDAAGKRKKSANDIRHPQKLFNPSEVNKREVTQQQGGYTYQGEFFDKEGYLEKSMKIVSLDTKNINPSLEEITKFSGGAVNDRGEDLSMLANANVAKATDFQTGEKIIILSGDLKNVPGVVHSVENAVVTIIPDKSFGLGVFLFDIAICQICRQ